MSVEGRLSALVQNCPGVQSASYMGTGRGGVKRLMLGVNYSPHLLPGLIKE
jgi:hypothetical protein